MKVSVCITTYNLENYISQTLESILNQITNFKYEIIIGDDGSTDATPEILKNFQRRYPDIIKLVLHKNNIGVNRNDFSILSIAQGEYIAWCDGDDYWIDNTKLQQQADILDNNSNVAFVHTGWIDFYEKDQRKKIIINPPLSWETTEYGKRCAERILMGQTAGCRFSSIMFRKLILLNFFNKEGEKYLNVTHKQNDLAYFCILALQGSAAFIPSTTTVYRIREESLSMSKSLNKRLMYAFALLKLKQYFVQYLDCDKWTIRQIMHKTINLLLLNTYHNNTNGLIEISTLLDICRDSKYTFTIGENLLILAIKYPF